MLDGLAFPLCCNVKWAEYDILAELHLNKSQRDYTSGLLVVEMARKNAWLTHVGSALFNGIADTLFATSAVQEAAGMRMEYPGLKVHEQFQSVMPTSLGDEALEVEKNRTLWEPILYYPVEELNR